MLPFWTFHRASPKFQNINKYVTVCKEMQECPQWDMYWVYLNVCHLYNERPAVTSDWPVKAGWQVHEYWSMRSTQVALFWQWWPRQSSMFVSHRSPSKPAGHWQLWTDMACQLTGQWQDSDRTVTGQYRTLSAVHKHSISPHRTLPNYRTQRGHNWTLTTEAGHIMSTERTQVTVTASDIE